MKRLSILNIAAICGLFVLSCNEQKGTLDNPMAPAPLSIGEGAASTTSQSGSAQSDKVCGGVAGVLCGEEEYCAFDVGDNCGAVDRAAVCEVRPLLCSFEFDPVCGCDGNTYGNECQAAAAGFGILHKGECK